MMAPGTLMAPPGGRPGLGERLKTFAQRLFDTRGGNYPGFDATPRQKADYVQTLLTDSEGDAMLRYKRATQAFLFSDGRQHIDWTNRDKAWRDQIVPEGRLLVTMNYVRPILRSRAQRMVSAELMWRTIPTGNDHEARDQATTCTNFLKNRWEKTDMDAKVRQGLWFAFHSGVAALKSFWNPRIGPLTPATMVLPHPQGLLQPPVDAQGQPNPQAGQPIVLEYPVDKQGQPLYDEQGQPAPVDTEGVFRYRPGDTDTALRSIFNIRLNPDAWGFLPDEGFRWLLDSEIVPISVVKERYGERAKNVSSLAGSTAGRNYERIIKSLSSTLGVTSPGGDLASSRGGQVPDKDTTLLTEYWEEPSELLPQGRLIVVCGTELLFPSSPEEEGLPQGFVPFVPVYDERRPFDGYGRGTVEDLIMPQKVINRQWEAEIEEQMRAGVGQWIMWNVPGLSDQITNMAGAHIKIPTTSALSNRPIGDVVQRVPPPGFNASRWRLIQEAKATMFDIGAFHEIQRGQVPPGVDSGVAVQYLQEAENAQLHDPVRNLKTSLKLWGRHQLKYAVWGYGANEQRWIPVHRPDLGFLIEGVTGPDLPDPDEVDIDLEGFRPTSQAAMRAEIKEFIDKQYIDPRQGLMLMDLGRGVEGVFESQTRHYARARMENLAIERGQVVQIPAPPETPTAALGMALINVDKTPLLLPADDDHLIHIQVHQELSLDNTKPWPVREAALLHSAEHRMMLMQVMTQAAGATQGEDEAKPGEPTKPEGPST
jgi:hypothetical protein